LRGARGGEWDFLDPGDPWTRRNLLLLGQHDDVDERRIPPFLAWPAFQRRRIASGGMPARALAS